MTPRGPSRAPEVKRALTDVRKVCDALGLTAGGPRMVLRQAGGLIVRCPAHEERTPSCSIQVKGGALVWNCHGCGAGGDVLSLVAAVRGLSTRREFRAVLVEAARLAGLWAIVDELEGRGPAAAPPPAVAAPPAAPPEPPRTWPAEGEVAALWGACRPVEADDDVAWYLDGRALPPARLDAGDLARTLPARGALPRWAVCRGGSWREAGYRLVVPCWDSRGALRSLRAWRVVAGDGPKRLPPYGHRAGGLVLADAFGRAMLRGERAPERIVITEGEPSFLSRCVVSNDPRGAVVGVWSGSWGAEFAARCPLGSQVIVRTDVDRAGDRYATEIVASVKRRCFSYRLKETA